MNVYAEAAALIHKDGWAQGWFYKPSRGHCVRGAIQAVLNGNAEQSDKRSENVCARLEDIICDPSLGLEEWNDEPHRTRADVLALLEQGQTRYGPAS